MPSNAKLGHSADFHLRGIIGSIMHVQTDQTPSGLLRLAAAARIAGLTPRAMARALASRDCPVAVVQIGKLQHVRAAELNTWLTAAPAPATADLFAA